MVDTLYFSHDYNSRNDIELLKLKFHLGHEGKSVFWDLVEMLYENDGYLLLDDIPVFAKILETTNELIYKMVDDYNLFHKDDTKFWSETALKRLRMRMDKSEKARESISKRWGKNEGNNTPYERNTNVIPSYNEGNTDKGKDKGKDKGEEKNKGGKATFDSNNPTILELKTNKYTITGEIFAVSQNFYDECVEIYPAVDVKYQFSKIEEWLNNNPEKRKTASGMKGFINGWLAKEQNKGGNNGPYKPDNQKNGYYPNKKPVVTSSDIKASRSKFIEVLQMSDVTAEQSAGIDC